VTCEVTPHHLFLTQADAARLGAYGQMRPPLQTEDDRRGLWELLDYVDCVATDHAPHTRAEKDGATPPPGVPGLETALPLLLTAVHAGRLTIEDVIARCYTHPQRIFHLPEQPETWIEVDPDTAGQIQASRTLTRAAWTPFEGMPIRGQVQRVVLHGQTAYQEGRILVPSGFGRDICQQK
jgi:carbamoyl-phosphate synthase/aspartate carbamoyltransferase/dihydroorotase